jgi:hypothetical protein
VGGGGGFKVSTYLQYLPYLTTGSLGYINIVYVDIFPGFLLFWKKLRMFKLGGKVSNIILIYLNNHHSIMPKYDRSVGRYPGTVNVLTSGGTSVLKKSAS